MKSSTRRRAAYLWAIPATALALAGCAAASDEAATTELPTESATASECVATLQPGRTDTTYNIGGIDRTVSIVVPSGEAAQAAVFALHGSNNSIDSMLAVSELDASAEELGFVLVVPQGSIPGESDDQWAWNVPGVVTTDEVGEPAESADDVEFLAQLSERIQHEACIDADQIFATGYSGGGRMISAVACDRTGVFAAIAPVDGLRAGTPVERDGEWIPDPETCSPAAATPVLSIAGDDDPINPYDGGGAGYWQYGQAAALARWAEINECGDAEAVDEGDGVTVSTWQDCALAPVVEYRVGGMGHTWPGRALDLQRDYVDVIGTTSDAIDANQVMWDFFTSVS